MKIEEIVSNMKNEVEMNYFIYVTPNEKDENGYHYEFTSDVMQNIFMKGKIDDKYNQVFKENYQYAIYLKNTKNVFALNFITKGTEIDKDFVNEYEKIDDGKTDWKVLDFILRNSYVCILECFKKS